jgi:hypothetical protein
MINSTKREPAELNLEASNTEVYERRQRDRRTDDVQPAIEQRRKKLDPELWWAIPGLVAMTIMLIALLWLPVALVP